MIIFVRHKFFKNKKNLSVKLCKWKQPLYTEIYKKSLFTTVLCFTIPLKWLIYVICCFGSKFRIWRERKIMLKDKKLQKKGVSRRQNFFIWPLNNADTLYFYIALSSVYGEKNVLRRNVYFMGKSQLLPIFFYVKFMI